MPSTKQNALRACIILSVITLTGYYLMQYRQQEVVRFSTQLQNNKEAFIETAIQNPIEVPFDKTAITDLCAKTTWTPGLIFQCDSPQGGVGNVENFFLNCVRFAIEAGAAFIVPQIQIRSQKDLSELTTHKLVNFSYLFDLSHFKTTLVEACPQMKLYDSVNDLDNFPTTAVPISLSPGDLSPGFVNDRVLAEPADWRASFDAFLDSNTFSDIFAESPRIIQIFNTLLDFPVTYDTPSFVRNFGRIIRLREDTRRLAASVLFEISKKFSLNQSPTSQIGPNAFFGAHLRTASDAVKAGWPGYDAQARAYLAQAAQHNLSIIYLASGSAPDISRFRSDAALQNCIVVTKGDLLSGADLEALGQLTWDQQALVDFEVLLRSSQFGGIEQSSFTWQIALRRHLLSKTDDYLSGQESMEDEFSVIYGGKRMGFFPLAMWP